MLSVEHRQNTREDILVPHLSLWDVDVCAPRFEWSGAEQGAHEIAACLPQAAQELPQPLPAVGEQLTCTATTPVVNTPADGDSHCDRIIKCTHAYCIVENPLDADSAVRSLCFTAGATRLIWRTGLW